jgi:hypothetical protein
MNNRPDKERHRKINCVYEDILLDKITDTKV